jgi:hypothetical protein
MMTGSGQKSAKKEKGYYGTNKLSCIKRAITV